MPRTYPPIRRLSYHFGSTTSTKSFALAYSTLSSASSSIMAQTANAASTHLKPTEMGSENAPASARGSISATTVVNKIPGRSDLPDEAVSNPHHVLKRGSVVGFKNPYPSHSFSPNFGTMVRRIWWYVRIRSCQERFLVPILTTLGHLLPATSRSLTYHLLLYRLSSPSGILSAKPPIRFERHG